MGTWKKLSTKDTLSWSIHNSFGTILHVFYSIFNTIPMNKYIRSEVNKKKQVFNKWIWKFKKKKSGTLPFYTFGEDRILVEAIKEFNNTARFVIDIFYLLVSFTLYTHSGFKKKLKSVYIL